jgi:medium-chain acyl-[acyl-carrier-protein] hydrolase
LQEFDGIPAEIANLPELAELLFPALRADFEAVETYLYESDRPRLGCRILAFGGLDDPRVSRERLEGWHSHTSSSFRAQYFPGDHFFLNTAREAVIATIADQLVSSRAKN